MLPVLPVLCLDRIVELLLQELPPTLHHVAAANLALVGNSQLTLMAQMAWDKLEPGCVAKHFTEQRLLQDNDYFEQSMARITPKHTLPAGLTEHSKVTDLKEFCRIIQVNVSGSKQVLWDRIQNKLPEFAAECDQAKQHLLRKRKGVACLISPATREEIINRANKNITASTAKSVFLMSEKDLDTLPCQLVTNPHYSCAAPMRLYRTIDVERLQFKKYGGLGGVARERFKRHKRRKIK